MAKIVFYCNDSKENLNIFEYYKQDIDSLQALGHEVFVCNKYREIPAKFDLIYIWWWTYAFYPVLLGRLTGKPTIITGAFNLNFPKGFEGVDYFKRPFWQRWLIKMATKMANLNLFINEFELQNCTKYFNIATGRMMPCTVGSEYITDVAFEPKLQLFNLAWSGKENLRRKGVPELLEAIALLKSSGTSVKVILAGQIGDGFNWMKARVKELGIEAEVSFLGPISKAEKLHLLGESEMYIQPSHYEGFGLGIAEAMSCKTCVITCDVGAVRSVVGNTGVYVKSGDASDIARAIKACIDDPEYRNSLKLAAHTRAVSEFSADKKINSLRGFLRELNINSQ